MKSHIKPADQMLDKHKHHLKDEQKLIWATMGNDISAIKKHILNGEDINAKNIYGLTPLHIAVINQNLDAVQFLLSQQADLSARAYEGVVNASGLGPVDIAFQSFNYELIHIFLNKEITAKLNDFDAMTALTWLTKSLHDLSAHEATYEQIAMRLNAIVEFSTQCEIGYIFFPTFDNLFHEFYPLGYYLKSFASKVNNEQINQLLLDTADILDNNFDYDAFLSSKLLTHLLSIEGIYQQDFINGEGYFYAESLPKLLPFITAHDLLNQFMESERCLDVKAFNFVFESFELVSDYIFSLGLKTAQEALFEAYQQEAPVVLPSGWVGHAVDIIFSSAHDLLIIANSGERYKELESGSNLFKVHFPENITPELFSDILFNNEQSFLELDLSVALGLEYVGVIKASEQTVGNCAWASHKVAVGGLLYLHGLTQGLTHDEACHSASKLYPEWEMFAPEQYLSTLIDNHMAIPDDLKLPVIEKYASLKHIDSYENFQQDLIGSKLLDLIQEQDDKILLKDVIHVFDVLEDTNQAAILAFDSNLTTNVNTNDLSPTEFSTTYKTSLPCHNSENITVDQIPTSVFHEYAI